MLETPGYMFGPYRLLPSRRLLLRDNMPIALTPKAFDTLVALVERRDRVVTREELLNHLWPGIAVEEANLTQQVFLLRKALNESDTGEEHIATIPRRGYRFVKDVAVLPADEPTRLPVLRRPARRRVDVAAGLLMLLVVSGVWFLWSTGRIGPGVPIDTANRVAVLPFTYRGANEHAYLGEGMVDLLSRTLDGAGALRTVEPRAVFGVLAQHTTKDGAEASRVTTAVDAARAATVAKALGVGQYVSGDIVEAAGTLRITARLHRAGAAADPVSASAQGGPDALFTLVDDLTKQLAIGGGTAPRLSTTAAATASLDALKAFLEGERFFRDSTGDPQKSAYQAYDRAVQLDPTFAIAWYRLSQSAYFGGGAAQSKVTEHAESAARHGAKLPWRERRLIEANWAYARGAARESQDAYLEILRRYPDDIEALFGLGLLGFEYRWLLGGPASAYKPRFAAFLRYLPDHLVALEILRNLETEDRNCAAADALNHRMHPTGVPWMSRAIAVFCGPPSEAQQALLRAPDEWPNQLVVARLRVAAISQNPRAAAVLARAWVQRVESEAARPGARAAALLALAELELALGHRKSGDEVFARLALVNPHWALADSTYQMLAAHHVNTEQQLRAMQDRLTQWRAESVAPDQGGDFVVRHNGVQAHLRTYLLGRISARLGEYDAARRLAGDLDRMDSPEGAGSVARDLAQSVRAHVLHSQGKYEEALLALEAALREVPFNRRAFSWAFVLPQDRFLRAELLGRLGRHEEALWWYQSLEYHPDAVLAGPAHLGEAKVLERLGRRQQAIDQYKRLLELWSDCDAEFQPLVEEARTALQRLGAG